MAGEAPETEELQATSQAKGSAGKGQRTADRRTTDTRARIEKAALDLFITKGFTSTSLRDIADSLGITKAALYYHFPAKTDIAEALVTPFLDEINTYFRDARGEGWTRRQILERYLDLMAPHLPILTAMTVDLNLLGTSDVSAMSRDWLDQIPELLIGPEPTSAERIRAIVAVSGLGRAMMLPGVDREELRTEGVDAALRALGEPTE